MGRPGAKGSHDFSRAHHDEDAAVTLLNDIRTVFDDRGVDRLPSAMLVADLVAMDDAMWADWRGLRDDQQPRRLSQGELARLLAPFGIRPRSIWPRRRTRPPRAGKGTGESNSRERGTSSAIQAAHRHNLPKTTSYETSQSSHPAPTLCRCAGPTLEGVVT